MGLSLHMPERQSTTKDKQTALACESLHTQHMRGGQASSADESYPSLLAAPLVDRLGSSSFHREVGEGATSNCQAWPWFAAHSNCMRASKGGGTASL